MMTRQKLTRIKNEKIMLAKLTDTIVGVLKEDQGMSEDHAVLTTLNSIEEAMYKSYPVGGISLVISVLEEIYLSPCQ
tara:strand:- start:1342 stop:1572 length:231 start_codon:yes stop_codon:yes gene_type:complete